VAASLLHWHPARAVFIVTPQTRESVASAILPKIQSGGWPEFDAGRADFHEIPDAQDFTGIVNHLRGLDDRVAAWLHDHAEAEVIADFTGGTKAMSAALALAALRWPCTVSYVGGTERTKEGIGVVVSGKEQILRSQNPADALGLLAFDAALELLRHHAFAAAAALLQDTIRRVTDLARKHELAALKLLAEALADWDRFQHRDALNKLRDLPKHGHNLEAALGRQPAQAILRETARLQSHLGNLLPADGSPAAKRPSRALILDLLANARRRMDEQRWDDATARLYRAIEATAQLLLAERGIPDTGSVPLKKIPEPLRTEFAPRAESGQVRLALQEAWRLLQQLDSPAAAPFFAANLADPVKSPLAVRNQSILAHGFAPATEKNTRHLLLAALAAVGAAEAELPVSPLAGLETPGATPVGTR
jgi:CRISPR-associated protein (TIGR02710 family)